VLPGKAEDGAVAGQQIQERMIGWLDSHYLSVIDV
jgi:hypothetical protein